jgi:hypothetical protein
MILLSVICLGLSGLSFDGEGRRKGRVEILENTRFVPFLRHGMSPNVPVGANEPNFRANPVHTLYDLTLCHLSWALWPFLRR